MERVPARTEECINLMNGIETNTAVDRTIDEDAIFFPVEVPLSILVRREGKANKCPDG